ncbi:hypothetical protein RvY_09000 [Ramazzottius varieornatus]|uniref:Neurotransmitter-gated ion-channel transmembrane domain-containing protein n=1 Tax=Ramazzottius varieornatus TaxID=947166 RepID=A0A1D1V7T5_RAMVA|nr:hypothetical protein RvY_09000 [Ramazzottius varieornatus]
MAPWVRRIFIEILPRVLCMQRPVDDWHNSSHQNRVRIRTCNGVEIRESHGGEDAMHMGVRNRAPSKVRETGFDAMRNSSSWLSRGNDLRDMDILTVNSQLDAERIGLRDRKKYAPDIQKAVEGVVYIADHIRKAEELNEVMEDWQFVAMVLDRLFLWIFTLSCVIGTLGILLDAPMLFDAREAIDKKKL